MSTVTTLIQSEEIVNQGSLKATPLSNRFDASQIAPNIAQAEIRFFKKSTDPKSSGFINAEFYDDLIAEKNPIPSNYNPDIGPLVQAFPTNALYETLWTQWFFAFLSKAAYHESLDGIVIQIGSNGAFLNETQFGQNVGISGLKHLKDTAMQDLQGYKPFIIKYLCDNKEDYPLWDDTGYCSECDNSPNKGRNAGFVFTRYK